MTTIASLQVTLRRIVSRTATPGSSADFENLKRGDALRTLGQEELDTISEPQTSFLTSLYTKISF
jgi:hypothetical protein